MNKYQITGTLIKLAGEVQTKFGSFFGSQNQINKGVKKQIAGEAQRSYGISIQAVKKARRY